MRTVKDLVEELKTLDGNRPIQVLQGSQGPYGWEHRWCDPELVYGEEGIVYIES